MGHFGCRTLARCAWLAAAIFVFRPPPLPAEQRDARAPVPDDAAMRDALEILQEVYEKDYRRAETPEQKAKLAKSMAAQAAKPDTDPVSRYALLYVGRNLAAMAGDVPAAMKTAEQMASGFQVDGLAVKAETIDKLAGSTHSASQEKALATAAVALADEAFASEKFKVAARAADIALEAARSARDGKLVRTVVERRKEIDAAAQARTAAQQALAVLKKQPADPDANLTVGRYYCFVQGNWEKGLPMLARSSNPQLKALAEKELKGAATPDDEVALADAWWDLAKSEKSEAGRALLLRAGAWYRQAQPDVDSPLTGVKITRRLQEIAKAGPIPDSPFREPKPGEAIRPGVWVDVLKWADTDWGTVCGQWSRSGSDIIGNLTTYSSDTGHGRFSLPVEVQGDYDLQVAFTRTQRNGLIGVVFPVGAGSCVLVMSAWWHDKPKSGLEPIAGGGPAALNATGREGALVNGKRYTATIHVRREGVNDRIDVLLDGKPYIQWKAAPDTFSVTQIWALRKRTCLGLGVSGAQAAFHEVRFRLVSGKASRIAVDKDKPRR